MALPDADPPAAKSESCPYLGIREDPQTCLAYPAEWNLCHHARPLRSVSLEHQRQSCLSPVYMSCPVFSTDGSAPLPQPFRLARRRRRRSWFLLAALLLATLGLCSAWQYWAGGAFTLSSAFLASMEASSPAGMVVLSPMGSASPLETSAIPSQNVSATLPARTSFPMTFSPLVPEANALGSPTAVKACGHSLETRIQAGEHVLTLHKVRRGESIAGLSANYETSLKALQAVNSFLPSPLWAELVIVIPVGEQDGQGLPLLEPYEVPGPGMTLEALAGQFSLTPQELAGANALTTDCPLVSGWLLVPRPAQKSP